MARKKKHPEHVNHERWLVSYADFITLLFAFFVVMFASSQVDTKKMGQFAESFSRAVGESFLMDGGRQLLPDGTPPHPEESQGSGEGKLPKELMQLARKLQDGHDVMSGLKILQRRNELVIRLSDSLLFDSGEDTLKEPAKRVVLSIADELRERKVDIRVEGHTDNVPIHTLRFRSNWDLSTARATAVIEELNGPGRIVATRLAASGYGEFRPVAPNTTTEGRAQNRRVDLVIAAALDLPVEEAKPVASAAPSGEPSGEPSAAPSGEPTSAVYGPPPPPVAEVLQPFEPGKEGVPEPAGEAPSAHASAEPSAHASAEPSEKPLDLPADRPTAEPAKDAAAAHAKDASTARAKEPPAATTSAKGASKPSATASPKSPAPKRSGEPAETAPPPRPEDLWMLRH
ncbi:MAG: flagellar motor protein MotB [Polyangiaceae bacterium]